MSRPMSSYPVSTYRLKIRGLQIHPLSLGGGSVQNPLFYSIFWGGGGALKENTIKQGLWTLRP